MRRTKTDCQQILKDDSVVLQRVVSFVCVGSDVRPFHVEHDEEHRDGGVFLAIVFGDLDGCVRVDGLVDDVHFVGVVLGGAFLPCI